MRNILIVRALCGIGFPELSIQIDQARSLLRNFWVLFTKLFQILKEVAEGLGHCLAPFALRRLIKRQGVSTLFLHNWISIFIHTCVAVGAVSGFLPLLSFAVIAKGEGDSSRLRLSGDPCLVELSMVGTKVATC